MKKYQYQNDKLTIMCEAYGKELKEALLEKEIGEKIVITAEVCECDCVNGYVVEIKKVN